MSEKHGLALLCAFFAAWAVIREAGKPSPPAEEPLPFAGRSTRAASSPASGAPSSSDDGPAMAPPEPAFKRDTVSLLSHLNETGAGGPPALMGASASGSPGAAASASAPNHGLGGGPSWQMPSASGGQGATASAPPPRGAGLSGSRPPPQSAASSSSGNGPDTANAASLPGAAATSASRARSSASVAAAAPSGGSAAASSEALGGPNSSGTARPSKADLQSAARGMTAMGGGGGGSGGGGPGGDDAGRGGGESFGAGGPTAPKPKKDGGASGGGAGGQAGAGSPRPKLHRSSSSGSGASGGGSDAADPDEAGLPVVGTPLANFKLTGTFFSMEPNTPATVQTFKTQDDKAIGFKAPTLTVCAANDCVADAAKDKPLDPGAIPFIVVPNDFGHGVAKGDYAAVTYGGKTVFAIVGDPGPKGVVGKGSIKLARPLNIPAGSSGTSARVTYVILPGSKDNPLPTTAVAIKTQGEKRFLQAGVPIR
jgi:glycosyl hydrolase group 75 (putative chitosanase)